MSFAFHLQQKSLSLDGINLSWQWPERVKRKKAMLLFQRGTGTGGKSPGLELRISRAEAAHGAGAASARRPRGPRRSPAGGVVRGSSAVEARRRLQDVIVAATSGDYHSAPVRSGSATSSHAPSNVSGAQGRLISRVRPLHVLLLPCFATGHDGRRPPGPPAPPQLGVAWDAVWDAWAASGVQLRARAGQGGYEYN